MNTLFTCFGLSLSLLLTASSSAVMAAGSDSSRQRGFIKNVGQVRDQFGQPNESVLYTAECGDLKVELTRTGFSYEIIRSEDPKANTSLPETHALFISPTQTYTTFRYGRVDFSFSFTPGYRIEHSILQPTTFNYISEHGMLSTHSYRCVTYYNVEKDIDIRFIIDDAGKFKYDIISSGSHALNAIEMDINGADVIVRSSNSLFIKNELFSLTERIPHSYAYLNGERTECNVSFIPIGQNKFKFRTDRLLQVDSLVVDPNPTLIAFNSFGGPDFDFGLQMKMDENGKPFICGVTTSTTNIATVGGTYGLFQGTEDVFIAKYSADLSTLVWATYYGGSESERAYGIALDQSNDCLYICGQSFSSSGIATIGSFPPLANDFCPFLSKFSMVDGSLVWGRFLNSTDTGILFGITVNSSDNPVVTGEISNSAYSDDRAAIVAEVTSNGSSINWLTAIDGGVSDAGIRICTTSTGYVVLGRTFSDDLPVTNMSTWQGESDLFVATLDGSGDIQDLGYMGGSHIEDECNLSVNEDGEIGISIYTNSDDCFTSIGAYSGSGTGYNAYFAILDSNIDYIYATYFSDNSSVYGLCTNGEDFIFTGGVGTSNITASCPPYSPYEAYNGTYIASFDPDGNHLWTMVDGHYMGSPISMDYSNNEIGVMSFWDAQSAEFINTDPYFPPELYYDPEEQGNLDISISIFHDHPICETLDCLNIPNGNALPGTECDDENQSTAYSIWTPECECIGAECMELVVITDGNPEETTWEIDSDPPLSGGPYVSANSTTVETLLLPASGCYDLSFHDSGNDGMCCTNGTGGYLLRTCDGKRIIDNTQNGILGDGTFASVSSRAGTTDFCLPLGPIVMMNESCDLDDVALYKTGNNVNCSLTNSIALQATPDAGWATSNDRGYRFNIFDPDGIASGISITNCASGTTPFNNYSRNIVHTVGNPNFPAAVNAGSPAYSFVNPSGWLTGKPPRNVWLNIRAQRVTTSGTTVTPFNGENFGPVCRVMFVDPGTRPAKVLEEEVIVELPQMIIWPNPINSSILNLGVDQLDPSLQEAAFELVDAMGRVVLARSIPTFGMSELNLQLELPALAAGLYLVQMSLSDRILTQRLIVQPEH